MSLKYILSQCGAKMGLNPNDATSNKAGGQRAILLRFVNEASIELYQQSDMAGSLVEQVFKVNGDQTISLPFYVGTVRAVREFASMQAWHINQMRPRYNQFNWKDLWANWRLKNKQALMASITNQSLGVVTVSAVEVPAVVVTVTGQTATASSISETVTMTALSVSTVNSFLDITSFKKDRPNNCDVTLSDVDGKLLTVIPNTETTAIYQIIDVSSAPWLPQNTSPLDNYVEVLYKKRLTYLSNDGDEFPAFDYDNIIVNKVMQLWAEEQSKPEIAELYDQKATRSMARAHEDQNRETEDMVSLTANPHDTLLRRIGSGIRRRYNLYSGRRY